MWPFDRIRQRRLLRRHAQPSTEWIQVAYSLPLLDGLSEEELTTLHRLSVLFAHNKVLEPTPDVAVDEALVLRITLQACLPILHLGIDWYDDWTSIIVYPGEFITRRDALDEAGVYHEWEEVVSGESWQEGPIVFSIADIEASGKGEGYNVVIHEMAHKLDMRNGDANGFPPLHPDMQARAWTDAMASAFGQLRSRVERDEPVSIDPYAAEDPAEFFAVLSEYFFEQPGLVKHEFPAAYAQLSAFYRQDPAERINRHR
ncbi:MAG: hypothetical protein AMJ69_07400 [Gammaproteobacteria bacterium SG8_47]|nr:MAG: hypothetical protein AMJ69_07400 [Gammaproteobacteria bacterium SG8_47]